MSDFHLTEPIITDTNNYFISTTLEKTGSDLIVDELNNQQGTIILKNHKLSPDIISQIKFVPFVARVNLSEISNVKATNSSQINPRHIKYLRNMIDKFVGSELQQTIMRVESRFDKNTNEFIFTAFDKNMNPIMIHPTTLEKFHQKYNLGSLFGWNSLSNSPLTIYALNSDNMIQNFKANNPKSPIGKRRNTYIYTSDSNMDQLKNSFDERLSFLVNDGYFSYNEDYEYPGLVLEVAELAGLEFKNKFKNQMTFLPDSSPNSDTYFLNPKAWLFQNINRIKNDKLPLYPIYGDWQNIVDKDEPSVRIKKIKYKYASLYSYSLLFQEYPFLTEFISDVYINSSFVVHAPLISNIQKKIFQGYFERVISGSGSWVVQICENSSNAKEKLQKVNEKYPSLVSAIIKYQNKFYLIVPLHSDNFDSNSLMVKDLRFLPIVEDVVIEDVVIDDVVIDDVVTDDVVIDDVVTDDVVIEDVVIDLNSLLYGQFIKSTKVGLSLTKKITPKILIESNNYQIDKNIISVFLLFKNRKIFFRNFNLDKIDN